MKNWDQIRKLCPKLYRKGIIFDCGIGWADIILDLSIKIEKILNDKTEKNHIYATQVKEHYGTLRFNVSNSTDEIYEMISETEALSSQTCEDCGLPAKMRGKRWIEVKCDICYREYK